MGLNALAAGAIKIALHRWPESRVFLLDYAKAPCSYDVPAGDARIRVPLVNMRFSKQIYLANHILTLIGLAILCRLMPVKRLRARVARGNSCLEAIDRAAFVASVAGGDSFSDLYGLTAFFYVSLPQILCLLWGTRLVMLPQTYGPYWNPIARVIAKWILRRAELICSRDFPGVPLAADLAGRRRQAEPRFCPDLGLLLDPYPPPDPGIVGLAPRLPGRRLVGLNVSGLLSGAGAKYGSRLGFKADYDSMITGLIDFLIRSRDACVLLVPHVFGGAEDSDTLACERLYRQLQPRYPGLLGLAAGKYDQAQIKFIIGSCDFFLGSRMHACIAAVSQAVPAVSLAYSGKFVGVMETLELGPLVADLRLRTQAEILQIVDSALANAGEWRARLEVCMPKAKAEVLALFDRMDCPAATGGR